jgi:hypothetical protein
VRLVLDSGALIALDRGDRAMWRRMKAALDAEEPPVTHGGVVGQVWRGGGPRQALLARVLSGIEIRPIDDALGRAAGELLAVAGASDVIDAAVVLLTEEGDRLLTSDPGDLETLALCSGRDLEIVRV